MNSILKSILTFLGMIAFVMFAAASDTGTKGDDEGDTPIDVPEVEEDEEETSFICDDEDETYQYVGGRHLCMRECRPGEVGPNGNECETKEDPGNGELFCDCGVNN